MSLMGDLRDDLEKVHDMWPLSDRERWLAERLFWGAGEVDWEREFGDPAEREWWGEKACQVYEWLMEE